MYEQLIAIQNEQDKVNYAVSEREDIVTDLTMLTRMTGCTGMFWAATGLYWDVLGCNWAVLSCTELFWAVQGCTGLFWTVLGCTGLYWLYSAVLDCTGLY